MSAIDVTDPTQPSLADIYDSGGSALGAHLIDSYLYIVDGSKGLTIIGVSNPSNLNLVGSYDTTGSSRAVRVSGSYAYVADNSGLVIVDIANSQMTRLVAKRYAVPFCLPATCSL